MVSPLSLTLKVVYDRGQACLRAFTADEELEGDDAHRCEKCRDRSHSTKALRISRCPPVLVLHLKRFSLADPADYLSPLEKVGASAHKLWGLKMVGEACECVVGACGVLLKCSGWATGGSGHQCKASGR